jgi:hypothetical protein
MMVSLDTTRRVTNSSEETVPFIDEDYGGFRPAPLDLL